MGRGMIRFIPRFYLPEVSRAVYHGMVTIQLICLPNTTLFP
jgi:hypothetical protein